MNFTLKKFQLDRRIAIITGGAGLLGVQHAQAIVEAGGIAILWDINHASVQEEAKKIGKEWNGICEGMMVDVTNYNSIQEGLTKVLERFSRVHILINNAAKDPKLQADNDSGWSRLETFSLDLWNEDIKVGLTGAFLCSQVIGTYMSKTGGGVILNIASDLGVISPDQRIYRQANLSEEQQPVKPVSYSVVKHGIIGLTKYLATYWADKNIRVNSISPGGIYNGQSDEFVKKLTNLIPLGRMAEKGEYKAAVLYLVSDASSYMTGANLIIDGGRTCL